MAIQFLNTLNFNQNEAVSFRLDNEPNDPTSPQGGQLYYNNTNDVIKFYDAGNSVWVTLADALNTGVTSITSGNGGASTGDPITINTAATGAITLNVFEFAGGAKVGFVPTGGTGTTFLAGDGNWDTPVDTGITGVTLATGTSTGVPLTESITARELTLTSMAYNGGANVGFVPSGGAAGKFLEGDGSWGTPTGTYKWNIQADQSGGGSNPEAVGAAETVDFVGGDLIKTTLDSSSSPFDLTIAHSAITTSATGVGPTVINGGDTFDVTTSLTNDGFGHITDVTTTTFELADFIPSGNITAQNGVKDTGSSNSPVIEVDYGATSNNVIASATSGTIGSSHWLMAAASGNSGPNGAVVCAQVSTVKLNDWAIPDGNVAMGTNGGTLYNIIDLKDPVNAQDAATKEYVDSVASGALQFKGSFDPATGEIAPNTNKYLYQLTGGNFDSTKARVEVEVGDLYIANGTGDFYANSATPLTAGDQVFGQTAAAANTSVEADWAVVQSDTDVATYTGIGIGNVNVQKTSAVAAGYHGSTNGAATGGVLNVDYTNPSNGTANISLREATSSQLGIISVKNGTGISVTYNNGEATISASGNPSGVRLSLGASSGNVTKLAATSTEQTWEIDCNAELGTTANNVTCQVIQESDGSTVFPDVTRSGDDMSISFSLLPSAPGNGDYEVLLISVS
jgi:hypothetical protein